MRINGTHRLADRRSQISGISRRANNDGAERHGALQNRVVADALAGVTRKVRVLHVAYHADNGGPSSPAAVADPLAHGILVRPILTGQILVNHGDHLAIVAIAIGEDASPAEQVQRAALE